MKYLWIVLVCAIGVECGRKVLRDENGEFSSTSSGSFDILIPAGKKIAIRIDQLDLKLRGIVKISSPSTRETISFKRERGTLYKINGAEKSPASIPANLELATRQVQVLVKRVNKFAARYAIFLENEDTCKKMDIGVEVTSCDTVDVNPIARQCNVTNSCPENYERSSNLVICHQGSWFRRCELQCLPKKNLMTEKCQIDLKAADISPTCPFSDQEVAGYFAHSDNPAKHSSLTMKSQSLQTIECGQTCARYGNGNWKVNCNSQTNWRVYVQCIYCRVVYKCGRETVIIP